MPAVIQNKVIGPNEVISLVTNALYRETEISLMDLHIYHILCSAFTGVSLEWSCYIIQVEFFRHTLSIQQVAILPIT